jgi:hypothetical protein
MSLEKLVGISLDRIDPNQETVVRSAYVGPLFHGAWR